MSAVILNVIFSVVLLGLAATLGALARRRYDTRNPSKRQSHEH